MQWLGSFQTKDWRKEPKRLPSAARCQPAVGVATASSLTAVVATSSCLFSSCNLDDCLWEHTTCAEAGNDDD